MEQVINLLPNKSQRYLSSVRICFGVFTSSSDILSQRNPIHSLTFIPWHSPLHMDALEFLHIYHSFHHGGLISTSFGRFLHTHTHTYRIAYYWCVLYDISRSPQSILASFLFFSCPSIFTSSSITFFPPGPLRPGLPGGYLRPLLVYVHRLHEIG